jgi:hypothetical protein
VTESFLEGGSCFRGVVTVDKPQTLVEKLLRHFGFCRNWTAVVTQTIDQNRKRWVVGMVARSLPQRHAYKNEGD